MVEYQTESCLIATNVNLIYMSGRVFSGYAFISADTDPLFFVKRPVGLSGDNVIYIRKPEDILPILKERGVDSFSSLGLETDQLTFNDIVRLQTAMGDPSITNATSILKNARLTKTPFEIDLLRKAGRIHCECYSQTASLFTPGMTDIDFSIEIERLFRQKGSLGAVRIFGSSMELHMGSVLAGNNAQTPSPYDFAMGGAGTDPILPISGNGTRIEPGMTVMVDVGGAFTANMSDMTRVFSLGTIPELAYKAHQVCLEIESDIVAFAKPGTACADLYNMAVEKAAKNGLSDYFMGTIQQAGFIGHGIGLELNESPVLAPRSKDILIEGMTFALEPKMVIPEVGAVGIENSYLVNHSGIENVTPFSNEIIAL